MWRSWVEHSRSRLWLLGLAVETAAVVALAAGARGPEATLAVQRELVSELHLTGLALGSEASYCRHPSQAEPFAPFAEHPGALEHLPAGSLVPPEATLERGWGDGRVSPKGQPPEATLERGWGDVRAGRAVR